MSTFDVVVVGAGPGGYVAAIRAAQLGQKVAIIEREHLGGICLNWGCIPTKALLRSAEIFHHMRHAASYGLAADNVRFDLTKIVERSRGVAKQLSGGIGHLLKKNKITLLEGTATIGKDKTITVALKAGGTEKVVGKNIILATGARARELPHLPVDGEQVWTYKHAMTPKTMPKSLLIIGSGAIGIEFASFYRTFGADVTVVEMQDRILPVEDAEISALARKSFEKQGMKILTNTQVEKLEKSADGVTVFLKDGKGQVLTQKVEKVIVAIGIVANTENLGLEEVGIKTDRGHVVVDAYCETDVKGVYAIGDMVAGPWLAHKASHEGVIVAEKIAGVKDVHPLNRGNIPGCTYSHPQIASVGMTEAAAKSAGYDVKIGRFPFIGNGKAIALGEPEGIVKTIFDAKTGALLGAHMIGAEVTEMIQGYVISRTLETTEAELMHTVFPHPTLSEMMHESALDAYGKAIHF